MTRIALMLAAPLVFLATSGCDGSTIDALQGPGVCHSGTSTLGQAARAADDLVESFGIKPVGMALDNPLVKERLAQLGVRYILLSKNVDSDLLLRLAETLDLRGMATTEDVNDALPALAFFGKRATAITVRNNEPVDATWGSRLRAAQAQLYGLVKGNGATRSVDVVGPNVQSDEKIAAAGDLSAWVDLGSFLPWREELWRGPPGQRAETDLARHLPVYGNIPMVVPQNGYEVSMATGVSQAVAAKYHVRTLLEHFRLGVRRTFIADLFDSTPGVLGVPSEGIGLIHEDGTAKLAFAALARTVALFADPGLPFAPGQLAYTLATQSPSVHQLLFQKRSGLFYLALWREVQSGDDDVAEAVTVQFPVAARKVTVFTPASSLAPVQEVSGQKIAVNVTDALTVLVIDLQCN